MCMRGVPTMRMVSWFGPGLQQRGPRFVRPMLTRQAAIPGSERLKLQVSGMKRVFQKNMPMV